MSLKVVVIPLEKYEKLKMKEDRTVTDKIADLTEKALHNVKHPEKELNIKVDNLLSEEDIAEYMPKTKQNLCRKVLYHMKKKNMHWDCYGKLVLNNECILATHIVDLIKDVISNNKKHCDSLNSNIFARLLKVTNCPLSIINKVLLQDGEITNFH